MKNWLPRPAGGMYIGTNLGDFPALDGESDGTADPDDGVGVVVQHVEHDDAGLEDAEKHRAHRETLQRLAVVPELDICDRGMQVSTSPFPTVWKLDSRAFMVQNGQLGSHEETKSGDEVFFFLFIYLFLR